MSCTKQYTVDFAKPEGNEFLDKMNFVYTGSVSCPQCSASIAISGMSKAQEHDVKCSKCKLGFKVDTAEIDKYKSIDKITELIPEPVKPEETEGKEEEKEMTEETKNKEEETKTEVKAEDKETKEAVETTVEVKEEVKTDDKVEEPTKEEEAPKATDEKVETEEKTEVVEKSSVEKEEAENKSEEASEESTNTPPEESETPQDNSAEEESNEEAQVETTEESSEEKETSTEAVEKASEDSIKLRKLLDRAVAKIVSMKKEQTLTKASLETTANEELEKVKEEAKAKIELYKANAKTIIERQASLGDHAKNLSEEDILNDDKFARIKAEKENAELKAQLETSSDVVGTKTSNEDKDYKKIQDEINEKAFNVKQQN